MKAGLDDSGLPVTSKSQRVLLMVLGQYCQGWGHFWDTVGRNWPERPTGTFPGPIKTPCLFTLRLCVSFTPTWVLSAGPLDRMAASPTSSGMAPGPHDPTPPVLTLGYSSLWLPPSELISSLTGTSGLGHSAGLWPQSQLGALWLHFSSSLSDCCYLHYIPQPMGPSPP